MLRIIIFSCFLFILSITAKAQNLDLSQDSTLGIATDKYLYNVKEPIKLKLSFKNSSNKSFVGTFAITSLNPNVKIYYRKIGSDFEPYHFTHVHGMYGPSEIWSETESTLSILTLLYDTEQKKFAFGESGEYELKATYKNIEVDKYPLLESNILRVQILTLDGEEEAIKAYSDEFLARLIQGDGFFDVGNNSYKTAINKAIFLAQKYPNSFYTTVLKNSTLEDLHRRIKSSSVGQTEQVLYNILKEHDTETSSEEKQDGKNQPLNQKAIDFLLNKAKATNSEKDKD